ncbi:UxaA family hydrolase [Paenibacillus sp. TAB 01]|uniref:UxaA family hydrolase n=1 Tax=Paenibacillus sp. TAB 01 TaxID=3368988 RepID=UPI003753A9F0
MTYKSVMLHPDDNVAVALEPLSPGTRLKVSCQTFAAEVELLQPIEFGHKFAVHPIGHGEQIRKYGEVIGVAMQRIEKGGHVHIHNLEGVRGRGDRHAE